MKKDGFPDSSECLNRLCNFYVVFLQYMHAKICLSGEELNNDGLGHNKHIIKGRIVLCSVLQGRDVRVTGNPHFFNFAKHSKSNLSPQHPGSILFI